MLNEKEVWELQEKLGMALYDVVDCEIIADMCDKSAIWNDGDGYITTRRVIGRLKKAFNDTLTKELRRMERESL